MATIRRPACAGSFYDGHPLSLKTQIEDCFLHRLGPGKLPKSNKAGSRNILGLISPHAGYQYSGSIAAHSYFELSQDGYPQTIIILGPNHRGGGSPVSIMQDGMWQTPFGLATIDTYTAKKILSYKDTLDIAIDKSGMAYEHSIEVQIPFLQFIYGEKIHFVPISLQDQSKEVSVLLGEVLKNALYDKDCVIIASSDFSHYEPQKIAEAKDKIAIDYILKFDVDGLYNAIREHNISMCGYGAISSMLVACKGLSAKSSQLLKYATSGDITHTYSQVVGYASFKITK